MLVKPALIHVPCVTPGSVPSGLSNSLIFVALWFCFVFFLRWDYTALLCILSYSLGCLVFGFFCSRFLDSGVLGVCQHA